jgi:hypothetical protein
MGGCCEALVRQAEPTVRSRGRRVAYRLSAQIRRPSVNALWEKAGLRQCDFTEAI